MAGGWRDVAGVRISPAELRFRDAVPWCCYRAALSVQNRRVQSCRLQLLPPRRPQFKLIVENPEKPVASGLQVTAFVEYYPESAENIQDRLQLLIEDDIVDIPVLGLIRCCNLEIDSEINFGSVIANSRIISKEIRIANRGSSSGTFKISYDGIVLHYIEPTSGVVEPKSIQRVKVDICTDVPRIIKEVIKVNLQGRGCAEVWIKAVVVEQILKVLGVSCGNVLECINFGPVYYGSSKTEQISLYNESPERVDWVAVLEDNAVGGEMGTDLEGSADAVLQDLSLKNRTQDLDASTLILCIPNQGTLLPYEKSLVTLCFSPKDCDSYRNLDRDFGVSDSPRKQDYVLFLRFEAVGNKDGYLQTLSDANHPHHTELALTGSGLPVMLTVNPGPVIKFMDCFFGEQAQVLCTLKNESDSLPVTFSFRKTAHFNISPEKGKIKKRSAKDVIFSFSPHQIGTFKVKQVVDIIGIRLEKNNLQALKTKSFHRIYLSFIGVCKSKRKNILFKINPGITPMISNATGQFVVDGTGQCMDTAPVAILKSTQTQVHTHRINRNCKDDALIAFPNDRAASIRPSERNKKYRTIFTKTERYNYIDPEFSYTDDERLSKEAHKEYYADFISSLRQCCLQKDAARHFYKYNNSVNIGLKPAEGLVSPRISITDLHKEKLQFKMLPSDENCLLTSRKLAAIASKSSVKEIWNGLSAVPSSTQEKEDCSLTLTSKQLHQILIGFVEAYRDLDCEVVWHPGFNSPRAGEFDLCVRKGNKIKLKCLAKLGTTKVQFLEQRIPFNHSPMGLSTCKTAVLQNIGHNHAYFQVLDTNPLPGMTITPFEGVVPVGGHADLRICFTPIAKMSFDTRVEVSVRNSEVLELRIAGFVEIPEINIDAGLFDFGGVYVGSTKSIPFLLQNMGQACTRVEFDFSKYKDFKLNSSDHSVVDWCSSKPHLYSVNLKGKSALQCLLSFMPKEVAAYDFTLPVKTPQPDLTLTQSNPGSATSVGSAKHVVAPQPQAVTVAVPLCRVKAVGRQSRIQVELPELELEDGDRICPFSVQFLEGQDIVLSSDGTNKELICHISFRSSKPVSFSGHMFFTDEEENRTKSYFNTIFTQTGHVAELKNGGVKSPDIFSDYHLFVLEDGVFETMSKRAWTDVLLQVYKVFVLAHVSSHKTSDPFSLESMQNMPRIKSEPLSSNIYSSYERTILTWLNKHYEKNRKTVWKDCKKGEVPPMRWIVNFDQDLLDSLVLAAQLAAYCPYLIATHFVRMYTKPRTPEQFLHNALILVNAMRAVSLAIDIEATDICDPNPVMMLILCVYLYESLPHYLPKKTIEFTGALHETVVKQVRLKNPSSKTLMYNTILVGRDAHDFSLPKGNTFTIAPRRQTSINVEFTSRFLRPAEAVLLLISKSVGGICGATLTFSLKSEVKHIEPAFKIMIDYVYSRVILLESTSYLMQPEQVHQARQVKQEQTFSSAKNILNFKNEAVPEDSNEENNLNSSDQSSLLPEFFSPMENLFLEGRSSASLDIHFLPFNLEKRYCTVILVNEQIGEFLYLIEGTGDVPLPSGLLPMDSPNVLHVSSTLEGPSAVDPVLYLKCIPAQILEENLRIPLINESKERALAIAAQQQMSTTEYKRRKLTGTLQSSSVRVATALLGLSRVERHALLRPRKFHSEVKHVDYSVEVSMREFFKVPEKLSIPVLASSRVNLNVPSKDLSLQKTDRNDAVELPIKFIPQNAGCYHCWILLKSSCDVRVYEIECVVNTDHAEAELEFVTPAYQPVIQDIPINNMSNHEWKLEAILEGHGFYGPSLINVGLGGTALYPLMFKPVTECITKGKLILRNGATGTETIFILKGTGKKPLAQAHIVIDCQVAKITRKILWVPNYTNNKLTYKFSHFGFHIAYQIFRNRLHYRKCILHRNNESHKGLQNVSSDLSMVGGAPVITVDPEDTVAYTLSVSPWRRGIFQGVISFVAEDEDQQQSRHNSSPEKTDGEQALQKLSAETPQTVDAANMGGSSSNCKVWFSLMINSIPAPPEREIDVKCRALSTTEIHIPITNPADKILQLSVVLENSSLCGQKALTLGPKETFLYQLKFSPAVVGTSDGSVMFLSDVIGEFWYALKLIVETPLPTSLPEIECELGKWTHLYIPLFNPTHETLELEVENSNPSNFSTETDPKHPLKEWIFYLSGTGLPPQSMEPTSISACIGQGSSVKISFKNPTPENVLVDVVLTGIRLAPKEKLDIPLLFMPDTMKMYEAVVVIHVMRENGENWPYEDSAELNKDLKSVTLAKNGGIQGILWIYPVRGIPEVPQQKLVPAVVRCRARQRVERRVEVQLAGVAAGATAVPATRNSAMLNTNKPDNIQEVQVTNGGNIQSEANESEYHGKNNVCLNKDYIITYVHEEAVLTLHAPSVCEDSWKMVEKQEKDKCQMRAEWGYEASRFTMSIRSTLGSPTTVEFLYELQYQSNEIKSQLESFVGLHLVQREQDTESGSETLTFNIVFAPNKPMSTSHLFEKKNCDREILLERQKLCLLLKESNAYEEKVGKKLQNEATLVVQRTTGGVWKFPVLFIAMEPEVDDVINIEAVGLNKEAIVGFKLTSQTRYPEPFTAHFLAGSDPEFLVLPQAGELLPAGTVGTHITVGFRPRMYGKKHKATLVIELDASYCMGSCDNGHNIFTIEPTEFSSGKEQSLLPQNHTWRRL
ncbi:Cfap47 [Columba guinea]|nr:Cfap47 [Columba guinea]